MSQLKSSTTKGVIWSAIERFSVQGINFLVQIILARLLCPEDYGVIGMLAIFMQVAQVLIDSGFANALIQKQKCTEDDYSTVFIFTIAISFLIYLFLFSCASVLAGYYNMPILEPVTKVISVTLILNAIPIVHRTKLVKNVDFKTQSKISFVSAVLSGFLGIVLAYNGIGVWSLCTQQVANSFLQMVLLFSYVKWHPIWKFSIASFHELFGFGSKLLLSSLINSIYRNLYTLVIGKAFSAISLGYYTRAEQFAQFPSSNLASIVSRVAFPIFSKIQTDNEKLKTAYQKMIRFSSLLIFPLMFGLIALSEPFICLVLSDKWSGVVILLQILCLDWMFDHITALNLNLLYVKGRSDLALKLEVVKKTIATVILFSSIPLGLEGMCWGRVLYSIIATLLNTHYSRVLIGLSFMSQFRDFYPYMFFSALMCISIMITNWFFGNLYYELIGGFVEGIIIYFTLLICFRREDLKELILLINKKK